MAGLRALALLVSTAALLPEPMSEPIRACHDEGIPGADTRVHSETIAPALGTLLGFCWCCSWYSAASGTKLVATSAA